MRSMVSKKTLIRSLNPVFNDANIGVTINPIECIEHQNPQLEKIIAQSNIRSGVQLIKQKLIDQDITIVIQQAMINKQCTKLHLSDNTITVKGAAILATGLQDNYTLERLDLSRTRVGDLVVQYFAKALSINNNILKVLHLCGNGITNDGTEHLAIMLKTNGTLTHLFRYTNNISDERVAMLANALQNHNNTLEYLNLFDNKLMSDLSVDFLVAMIKCTCSLKALFVNYCNLSKNSEDRLRKAAQSNKNIKMSVNSSWTFWKNFRFEL